MLAKTYRLSGRLVAKIHAKGQLFKRQNLTIKSLPNSINHPRLAVVVPKKVDNRATKRNRLKRQIISLVETEVRKSNLGVDLLVLVYSNQSAEKIALEVKKWFAF